MKKHIDKITAFLSDMSETKLITLIAVIGFAGYGLYVAYESITAPNMAQGGTVISTVASDRRADVESEKRGDASARHQFTRAYKDLPLSTGEKIPLEKAQEITREIIQNPFNNHEKYKYSFRLPKNWKESDFAKGLIETEFEPSFDIITTLARYFGPSISDMVPFIRIDALDIPFEMSAQHFLNIYMEKNVITTLGQAKHSKNKVEALYLDIMNQATFAVRTMLIKQGDTAIFFTMAVPMETYEKAEELIGYVMNSFHLLQDVDEVIEQRKEQNLLGFIDFSYFESWELTNINDRSTLYASFKLRNKSKVYKDVLNGLIDVAIINISPRITIAEELKARIEALKTSNIYVKDLIDTRDLIELAEKKNYELAKMEIYDAELVEEIDQEKTIGLTQIEAGVTPQEVSFALLSNGDYIVIITLISPTRYRDYQNWARNVTHFEHLVNTINIK